MQCAATSVALLRVIFPLPKLRLLSKHTSLDVIHKSQSLEKTTLELTVD